MTDKTIHIHAFLEQINDCCINIGIDVDDYEYDDYYDDGTNVGYGKTGKFKEDSKAGYRINSDIFLLYKHPSSSDEYVGLF